MKYNDHKVPRGAGADVSPEHRFQERSGSDALADSGLRRQRGNGLRKIEAQLGHLDA
jgi:hypothetical protein